MKIDKRMKLKYYLRGLATGLVIATALMFFAVLLQ